MEDVPESKDYSFPKGEEAVLHYWDSIDAFKEQLRRTEGLPEFVFYDGPPFATGLPHYGHILAGTIKDIVTRYASVTGRHVIRRFGWDCHGLPVEYEIDKKLGISSREDVLSMGIDKYNEECRSIVMRYSAEWEQTVTRLGRWIDFKNDYKTLDVSFMESVWWVFKQLFDKGLVYRGFKVMPYSTGCSTALSNFEAGLNYKDVSDPAIMVAFQLEDDPDDACMVAWTTTPWTLPSNLALCVNPEFDYVRVRDTDKNRVLIVAEVRLEHVPGAVPKKGKGKKAGEERKPWPVLGKVKGTELAGKKYVPLFPYFAPLRSSGAFRVVADSYVTADSGTGVVHCAPAFGEDDYRVCMANGIVSKGDTIPCPVDDAGRFTPEVTDYKGQYVKDADKEIMQRLKAEGRLVDHTSIVHSYPFCWRSDKPLLYKAVPSWFVGVEQLREKLLANNLKTRWVPAHVQEKRFHNWLESAHDWAISRSRFWGTPIPIWISDDGEEIVVVGSKAELEELGGHKITDLHRHFIDHITIPSRKGKGVLRRVDDVFDCWFESGSMPYAYIHYPFENKKLFEDNFPADFVAEGLDQTRGWFYTLMVLATALFDKPAFKNLICNGLVLAADGKKMSKRLKNYPDPTLVIDRYGADALRLYLINSPVVRAETLKFQEEGVKNVVKDVFLPWYNAYRFLAQNVSRYQHEAGKPFDPSKVDLDKVSNVLDRWLVSSTRHLVNFVHEEMAGYRLYTVVPYLVKYIEQLTNIYVRYNRKRLKGKAGGEEGGADTDNALATLYHSLLVACKVMSPFTPFFTETMYQNLRKLQADAPESIHFCSIPPVVPRHQGDAHIEESVERMQRVIELARAIRERANKPLRLPLKELVVVHTDKEFLADVAGELHDYVTAELNVRALTPCSNVLQYCTLRGLANTAVLGKKLGKALGPVRNAVEALSTEQLLQYEQHGSITVEGVPLGPEEIKLIRDFKFPEGRSEADMAANGDGELLVVLDLVPDAELLQAGVAREFVNRVQKLRKKAGLVPTDKVDVFFDFQQSEASNGGVNHAEDICNALQGQTQYLEQELGMYPLPFSNMPPGDIILAEEQTSIGTEDKEASIRVAIARPSVAIMRQAVEQLCNGDAGLPDSVALWLASRQEAALRREVEAGAGKVQVQLDGRTLQLQLGTHFAWRVADAVKSRT